MILKLIKEEIPDSELKSRIELLTTLNLQEGYTREMLELDARALGICEYCIQEPQYKINLCKDCLVDLRGERHD